MTRLIPLALFSILLSGCQSRYVRLDAVGSDDRMGRNARYVVQNEKEGFLAAVTITAAGHRREKLSDRVTDTVSFVFNLDNPSGDPLGLPIEKIRATDDEGVQFTLVPSGSPPPQGAAPGSRVPVTARLLFDTGGADRLRTTGGITLEWDYAYRNRTVTHRTRFLPVRYVRQYYPASGYYYPAWHFGVSYHGHW